MQVEKRLKYAPFTGNTITPNLIALLFFSLLCFFPVTTAIWFGQSQKNLE